MDFTCRTRALSSLVRDIEKGKYNMHHRLQRKEGQWSKQQASELIDSLLRSYPIDPIRCEKGADDILYIFDGVQRSTSIYNFITNPKFKLAKNLNPVVIDGEPYDLAGLSFNNLMDPVREKLLASEIQVYVFTDCTDNDIREMYRRQNNGKAMTNTQKRTAIESTTVSQYIFSLANSEFFTKVLSKKQLIRDTQRDLVRETLMLINTTPENDFTSFRSPDIDKFILWYAENIDEEQINALRYALTRLDESFDEKLRINTLSIPTMLYASYRVLKEEKDFEMFVETIKDFVENFDNNEAYKQFCSEGTSGAPKVQGRLTYWNNLVDEL